MPSWLILVSELCIYSWDHDTNSAYIIYSMFSWCWWLHAFVCDNYSNSVELFKLIACYLLMHLKSILWLFCSFNGNVISSMVYYGTTATVWSLRTFFTTPDNIPKTGEYFWHFAGMLTALFAVTCLVIISQSFLTQDCGQCFLCTISFMQRKKTNGQLY